MSNPIAIIKAGLGFVSAAGKGLGKAQKFFAVLQDDSDKNGVPEYKDALNGLVKMFHKIKDESIPLLKKVFEGAKKHFGEYQEMFAKEVLPHIVAVFKAAQKAALEE